MTKPKDKTHNPYNFETEEELFFAWKQGYEYELASQPFLEFSNHKLVVTEPTVVKNPYDNEILQVAWTKGHEAYIQDIQDIPQGCYCYSYDSKGQYQKCPYYFKYGKQSQNFGACSFLGVTDKDETSSGDLWDQLKECGIKFDDPDETFD